MISEVIPPVESSNHNNHDNNEDNESTTPFAENILGSNFKDCVGSLPLINTLIKLEVGTSFYSMTIAVHYIEQFALQNNFAIFKHKSEKFLDGTCRKKVLKCDLGGRYTQKLLRPTSDKMTMKGSKKQGLTVTQFHSEHNHEISTETLQFAPTYRTFPEEIMDQIEFYVIHGRCDALMVRNLLQSKYPDCVFLTQDLGNAIQKIKQKNGISLGGAASLLLKLLDLQANNPAWFVKPLLDDTIFILIDNYNKSRLAAQAFLQDERQESYEWLLRCCLEACEISPLTFVTDGDPAMIAAVSTVFPEAHHMQCLFHLYQNLPKNLRSCLGSSLYQEFLKDFRAVQRSHCEKVFEQKSQNLVEKYAAGERYISTVLLNQKHTWVVPFQLSNQDFLFYIYVSVSGLGIFLSCRFPDLSLTPISKEVLLMFAFDFLFVVLSVSLDAKFRRFSKDKTFKRGGWFKTDLDFRFRPSDLGRWIYGFRLPLDIWVSAFGYWALNRLWIIYRFSWALDIWVSASGSWALDRFPTILLLQNWFQF
ncbi:unnamed protein product [Rhizophagus irregularis]|nr:unnamed protein product [Rhizophagus irregularis]